MGWSYDDDMSNLAASEYSDGTVSISSREYRSLVEQISETRRLADKEHQDWHDEYYKNSDLEKQIRKLKADLDAVSQYKDWVKSDETLETKFKLWKLETEEKENEEDV